LVQVAAEDRLFDQFEAGSTRELEVRSDSKSDAGTHLMRIAFTLIEYQTSVPKKYQEFEVRIVDPADFKGN